MMKRSLLALLSCLLFATTGIQALDTAATQEEVGVLKTSMGTMVIRFYEKDSPQTVANFKKLVREGFYDGKRFYRVVAGHVIQTGDNQDDNGRPKVKGEFNSHPFVIGTVGLARNPDPDSGSTEVFICLAPRPHLDGKYAAFGELIEGIDVLHKIGAVEVNEKWLGDAEPKVAFHEPKTPVVIEKATIEKRPAV
ncbi:MAG TPA: peptidylprolyl isomerase [Thermoanaerobaculia bacterium]|nr:peptidylprolyl isomerase [Thermoanaerobaculia bacterium]